MALPRYVTFEGLAGATAAFPTLTKWSYRRVGYRPPRKGEYYLSGAVVMAYKAPNDLSSAYMVVEPVEPYRPATVMVPYRG